VKIDLSVRILLPANCSRFNDHLCAATANDYRWPSSWAVVRCFFYRVHKKKNNKSININISNRFGRHDGGIILSSSFVYIQTTRASTYPTRVIIYDNIMPVGLMIGNRHPCSSLFHCHAHRRVQSRHSILAHVVQSKCDAIVYPKKRKSISCFPQVWREENSNRTTDTAHIHLLHRTSIIVRVRVCRGPKIQLK
jgi:hypothetical protein